MSSIHMKNQDHPSLAIIGGGLAGIAAAARASQRGFRVTLFERARILGGKAASILDPDAGQWINNGQHVTMGCCTQLLELHRHLALDSHFQRLDSIPFLHKSGACWNLKATSFLPKSLQFLPSLLTMPFLSWRDRLACAFQLRTLSRPLKKAEALLPFSVWLEQRKVSQAATKMFWLPLVLSTLSETLEQVCVSAVQKVVCDGFLAGKDAAALFLPTDSLRAIYGVHAAAALERLGVTIKPLARVRRLICSDASSSEAAARRIDALEYRQLGDGAVSHDWQTESFDAFILAVPAFRAWEIINASNMPAFLEQLALDHFLSHFEPGAITSVHLWLAARLLPDNQSCAALLDEPGQMLFCPPHETRTTETRQDSSRDDIYHTVVISAAHRLLSESELASRDGSGLIHRVINQLATHFPSKFSPSKFGPNASRISGVESAAMELIRHARVTTYFDAVFSPNAQTYHNRPSQRTMFSNLALAGDWTETRWPATLEGAVRSGNLAAECLDQD